MVLLLCTGEFPPMQATGAGAFVVQPHHVLHGLVASLAQGRRVGVFVPHAAQVDGAERRWREAGVDAAIAVASPYSADAEAAVAAAAAELRRRGVELAFMDCFGYSLAHRRAAAAVLGRPIVLARSCAARIVAELAGSGGDG